MDTIPIKAGPLVDVRLEGEEVVIAVGDAVQVRIDSSLFKGVDDAMRLWGGRWWRWKLPEDRRTLTPDEARLVAVMYDKIPETRSHAKAIYSSRQGREFCTHLIKLREDGVSATELGRVIGKSKVYISGIVTKFIESLRNFPRAPPACGRW